MSRLNKLTLLIVATFFVLACNLVTQPIKDVQNIAGTAESFATALPFETLQALATSLPVETLQALPTELSQLGNYFDPQGTPAAEWNGIPIMAQATAGQEFDTGNYSFRFSGAVKEAVDFYNDALAKAGWSTMMTMPGNEDAGLLVFQKDDKILTVTVTNMNDGTTVVLLTLA